MFGAIKCTGSQCLCTKLAPAYAYLSCSMPFFFERSGSFFSACQQTTLGYFGSFLQQRRVRALRSCGSFLPSYYYACVQATHGQRRIWVPICAQEITTRRFVVGLMNVVFFLISGFRIRFSSKCHLQSAAT